MNKNIIIAILVVIIVAIAGYSVFSSTAPAQKTDTEFNILSDNSLSNGDQFQFQLKEVNGTAISGEKVQIGLTDSSGNVETYDVVTDSDGKGALVIENEDDGSHDLTLSYAGNDKYKECNIKLSITIDDDSDDSDESDDDDSTEDVSDDNSASSNDTSNSSSDTPDNPDHLNYDKEHDVYYTDDGTIVGDSQWSGANYYELEKRGDDWFKGIH